MIIKYQFTYIGESIFSFYRGNGNCFVIATNNFVRYNSLSFTKYSRLYSLSDNNVLSDEFTKICLIPFDFLRLKLEKKILFT